MNKHVFLIEKLGAVLNNKKVLGIITDREKEELLKKISRFIAKEYTKVGENEIYEKLNRIKLIKGETNTVSFGGDAEGLFFYNMGTILCEKTIIDEAMEGEEDATFYHVIIHEYIHSLQVIKSGLNGFIEGATELMTQRITESVPRSMSTSNGEYVNGVSSSTYCKEVAVMQQLEVMFGEEKVKDFAFEGNMQLIDDLKLILSKREFETLRKDLNRDVNIKDVNMRISEHQDILLERFFDKDFSKIKTQEEAEEHLKKLQKMDKIRIRKKEEKGEDIFLKEYYENQLAKIKEMFPKIDVEKYKYETSELYPSRYPDEVKEDIDDRILSYFCFDEEYKNIDFEKCRRYRYINDNRIFDLIAYDSEIKDYVCYYPENDELIEKNDISDIFFKSGLKIECEDGKIFLSLGQPLLKVEISKYELEEIPLDITEEKIQEERKIREEENRLTEIILENRNIFKRIINRFKKKKMLPESKEEGKIEEIKKNNTKKSWELTEEEKNEIFKSNQNLLKEYENKKYEKTDNIEL